MVAHCSLVLTELAYHFGEEKSGKITRKDEKDQMLQLICVKYFGLNFADFVSLWFYKGISLYSSFCPFVLDQL